MASSDLKFKQTTSDRLSLKGVLSDSGDSLIYMDEDKVDQTISLRDLFSAFQDQPIELTIVSKSETDLDITDYCASDQD